jgi:hypothetical protein
VTNKFQSECGCRILGIGTGIYGNSGEVPVAKTGRAHKKAARYVIRFVCRQVKGRFLTAGRLKERGRDMSGSGRMGTSMQIHIWKSKENKYKRRDKRRCRFYSSFDDKCSCDCSPRFMISCMGSAHCEQYKEADGEDEESS